MPGLPDALLVDPAVTRSCAGRFGPIALLLLCARGTRHRRSRVLDELRGMLLEPGAGGRIRAAALGVRAADHSAVALAVGLAGDLDPQVRVDERVAGAGGRPKAEAAIGRVAPGLRVLVVLVRLGRPRAAAVAAGIDD